MWSSAAIAKYLLKVLNENSAWSNFAECKGDLGLMKVLKYTGNVRWILILI